MGGCTPAAIINTVNKWQNSKDLQSFFCARDTKNRNGKWDEEEMKSQGVNKKERKSILAEYDQDGDRAISPSEAMAASNSTCYIWNNYATGEIGRQSEREQKGNFYQPKKGLDEEFHSLPKHRTKTKLTKNTKIGKYLYAAKTEISKYADGSVKSGTLAKGGIFLHFYSGDNPSFKPVKLRAGMQVEFYKGGTLKRWKLKQESFWRYTVGNIPIVLQFGIKFENKNTKHIFNLIIQKTQAMPRGVEIMLVASALTDGNKVLYEKKAREILNLLYLHEGKESLKQNEQFSKNTIKKTLLTCKEAPFLLDFVRLPLKARQLLIAYCSIVPTLYLLFKDKSVRKTFQKLSRVPGIRGDDLIDFLRGLASSAKLIDPATGYKPKKYFMEEEFYSFLRRIARIRYHQVEFEKAYKIKFEQNKNNPAYLEGALKSSNALIRREAVLQLGKLKVREDLVRNIIQSEAEDFEVIKNAFVALASFNTDTAQAVYKEQISKGSFLTHLYAGEALTKHFSLRRTINLLFGMMNSPDIFVRGEGASLFKYLVKRKGFNKYKSKAKQKLLKIAFHDKNILVRALAIDSLGHLKDKRILAQLTKLEKSSSITIKMKAKEASRRIKGNYPWPALVHRSDRLRYYTKFFKLPSQLDWIVDKVRARANQIKKGKIHVLEVGSSIGLEPLSMIMSLLEDYSANKSKWGSFNPQENVKILATDINLEALLYLNRGRFTKTSLDVTDEMLGIERYARLKGINPGRLQSKYFDYNYKDNSYRFKSEYKKMLDFEYFNVLTHHDPLAVKPYITVYNNVDMYFDIKGSLYAAQNIRKKTERYVTCLCNASRMWFGSTMKKIANSGKHLILYDKSQIK